MFFENFQHLTCHLLKAWTVIPIFCGKKRNVTLPEKEYSPQLVIWVGFWTTDTHHLPVPYGSYGWNVQKYFTTFDRNLIWSKVFFHLVAHSDMFIYMPCFLNQIWNSKPFGNYLDHLGFWDLLVLLAVFVYFVFGHLGFTAPFGGRSFLSFVTLWKRIWNVDGSGCGVVFFRPGKLFFQQDVFCTRDSYSGSCRDGKNHGLLLALVGLGLLKVVGNNNKNIPQIMV